MRTHLNLKIFIYCFVVSLLLWIFIKLSKEYEQLVRFNISFIEPSDHKLYVSDKSTKELEFIIKENGAKIVIWNILPPTIYFDLSDYNSVGTATFSKELMMDKIEKSGLNRYHIISSYTDRVLAEIARYDSVNIPIEPKTKVALDPSYQLSNIHVSPSEVTVFGPLEQIKYLTAHTAEIVIDEVDQFQSGRTTIQMSSPNYKSLNTKQLTYALELNRYTEQSLEVPITIVNPRPNMRIKLFPNKVLVSGRIPFEQANNLNATTLEVTADMSTVTDGDKTIMIVLTKRPKFFQSPKLKQSTVEFISIQQ